MAYVEEPSGAVVSAMFIGVAASVGLCMGVGGGVGVYVRRKRYICPCKALLLLTAAAASEAASTAVGLVNISHRYALLFCFAKCLTRMLLRACGR